METWKDIRGYEGLYQISDLGRIRSYERICNQKNNSKQKKASRILTQEISIHGYCRVRLYNKDGKSKHYAVHRLVLSNFLCDSDLQVNHINEIKTDNRLSNLEYCTAKQNCNHGTRNLRIKKATLCSHGKPVEQLTANDESVSIYKNMAEAERETNVCAGNIGRCCSGDRKTAGGYKWKFVNG